MTCPPSTASLQTTFLVENVLKKRLSEVECPFPFLFRSSVRLHFYPSLGCL